MKCIAVMMSILLGFLPVVVFEKTTSTQVCSDSSYKIQNANCCSTNNTEKSTSENKKCCNKPCCNSTFYSLNLFIQNKLRFEFSKFLTPKYIIQQKPSSILEGFYLDDIKPPEFV